MNIPRSMCFIDGENIVMRYQAMIEAGRIPNKVATHERDCFLWHPKITEWAMFDLVRVNYYTSTTGDTQRVEALKNKIAYTNYSFSYTHGDGIPDATAQLIPHVFHKPSRNTKTRNVDLQISIDILRAAHLNNVEIIYLLSGDGDYVPLIQEAARFGKEIHLAAFSSGLSPQLRCNVDNFQLLDDFFFRKISKPKPTSQGTKTAKNETLSK